MAALTLSEAIQKLPQGLRGITYKHYLRIKLKQRADLGWDKVHE